MTLSRATLDTLRRHWLRPWSWPISDAAGAELLGFAFVDVDRGGRWVLTFAGAWWYAGVFAGTVDAGAAIAA